MSLLLAVGAIACTPERDPPPPPPTPTPAPTPTPTPAPAPAPSLSITSPDPTTRVVAGVYRLVASRPDPSLDATASLLSTALAAFVPARFRRLPSAPITVFVIPTVAEYNQFCAKHYSGVRRDPDTPSDRETCLDSLGIYFHPRRELVVDVARGRTTLLHELAHTLFEDFPAAPLWFDEGVSSLYEWPDFPADPPGAIHGKSNFRHQRVLDALASPTERGDVRLDALFGMGDDAFLGKPETGVARTRLESLHYGVAHEMCRWLDARGDGSLWRFYAEWRDRSGVDPTGEAAFYRVVGETPEHATAEWLAWVLDRKNDDRSPGRVP